MVELLDVNVLLALAWPTHLHHRAARDWFGSPRADWATCSFTEVAFVRLSSNRKLFPTAPEPAQALAVLSAIRGLPGHVFLPDQNSLTESPFSRLIVGHRQVTDAHLLTLAHNVGGKLVTFDRAILNLIPSDWESEIVTVLEA